MNPSAEERARLMKEVLHDLFLELPIVQERHKDKADRHQQATPGFEVGIFQQLAHATNLITKNSVHSASLT